MKVFFADHQPVHLPKRHRFPMAKYRALRFALVERGVLAEQELAPAPLAAPEVIEGAHDPSYVRAVLDGTLSSEMLRRIGFPWSRALVRRTLASVGGTLAAAADALESGISGTLAGGTHHACRDSGAGYCVFNDLAVTAKSLLDTGRIGRVLVFDVDVHQGDGTAAMFRGDARVYTCSVHGARNFPLRKQSSDLDVALPDNTGDDTYLDAVSNALDTALAASIPDIVLVQAGVDALAADTLGRLSVSLPGLLARDRLVIGRLVRASIPVVLTLGGGYADPIERSIDAHVGTYRAAKDALATRA